MKTLTATLFLSILVGSLWSQTVRFQDVQGQVEYKTSGEWLPAQVGQEIPVGSTLSTGFHSTATVEMLGSSVTLRPLTRLRIDELEQTSVATKTHLTLSCGAVQAEVAASTPTLRTLFEVKGTGASVSLRGAGFEFDGNRVIVSHGDVRLAGPATERSVTGGEVASASRGAVNPPASIPGAPSLGSAEGGTTSPNLSQQLKDLPSFPAISTVPANVSVAVAVR